MGRKTKLDRGVNNVFLKYGTIVTSFGVGNEDHFEALKANLCGLHKCMKSGFNGEDHFIAKIEMLQDSRYDHLLKIACLDLIKRVSSELLCSPRTLVIVSSTKGNIETSPQNAFSSTKNILRHILGIFHPPVIVSNACASGVIAINLAADCLKFGKYDDVVVIGIDTISDFILFGFQSLFALSDEPTKPFDSERKGISLGEACGIIIISSRKGEEFSVQYCGGASSNDANHISGPSRTGEGLVRAVQKTLMRSGINSEEIDYISAHGTGTIYNDEMESIAFTRLGLMGKPINSLKSYFGHTLGAAGIIEVIVSMISIEKNILFKSLGFSELGTSEKINVISKNEEKEINLVLKTASGFGGTNAAILIKKVK
jgi:3-oxoacyl-[acyl-carrier-protein] synthase-1